MVSTVSTSSLGLFEYKDCKVLKRFGVDHSKLEIDPRLGLQVFKLGVWDENLVLHPKLNAQRGSLCEEMVFLYQS